MQGWLFKLIKSHYGQNFMHKLAVPEYQYDNTMCLWEHFDLLVSKKQNSYRSCPHYLCMQGWELIQ